MPTITSMWTPSGGRSRRACLLWWGNLRQRCVRGTRKTSKARLVLPKAVTRSRVVLGTYAPGAAKPHATASPRPFRGGTCTRNWYCAGAEAFDFIPGRHAQLCSAFLETRPGSFWRFGSCKVLGPGGPRWPLRLGSRCRLRSGRLGPPVQRIAPVHVGPVGRWRERPRAPYPRSTGLGFLRTRLAAGFDGRRRGGGLCSAGLRTRGGLGVLFGQPAAQVIQHVHEVDVRIVG